MIAVQSVGFQGEAGAFSQQAARALLGEGTGSRGYVDFDALVGAVGAGDVTYALLPCENSIYGPIARAYDLLLQNPKLSIVDETSLAIVQCLIGVRGATLTGIERVISHPVALDQCLASLKTLPNVKFEAVDDTAGAVRAVLEDGNPRVAAIGPRAAAEIYGGVVLRDAVQDENENVTRFFLLSRDPAPRRRLGRMCVAFELAHEPGSLHRALGIFAERDLNLRSLVARPCKGRPFGYSFIAEIDWPDALGGALPGIPGAIEVRVLGRF
jgi:prephenate dehydratase